MVRSRPATEAAFWRADAGDLGRVDDACFEHVAPLAGLGVVAVMGIVALLDAADDDRAVDAGVLGDVPGRLFDGAADDFRAELLVAGRA